VVEIFIPAKDKLKSLIIKAIARLAIKPVVSFWPASAFFADSFCSLRSNEPRVSDNIGL
jgi:hypothetical protein